MSSPCCLHAHTCRLLLALCLATPTITGSSCRFLPCSPAPHNCAQPRPCLPPSLSIFPQSRRITSRRVAVCAPSSKDSLKRAGKPPALDQKRTRLQPASLASRCRCEQTRSCPPCTVRVPCALDSMCRRRTAPEQEPRSEPAPKAGSVNLRTRGAAQGFDFLREGRSHLAAA